MQAKSNRSAWVSKKLFLLIFFLALIGKATCILESPQLFQLSPSTNLDDVLIARNDATEILDGKPSVNSLWFLERIGWRNTGKNPEDFEHPEIQSHVITMATKPKYLRPVVHTEPEDEETESDVIHAAEYKEKVNIPLYRCLCNSNRLPLKEEAKEELNSFILDTMDRINTFSKRISGGYRYARDVFDVRKNIQKAHKILKDPVNFIDNASITSKPLLSMAFRLNDILVRFLAITNKHKNLIDDEHMAEIINEEGDTRMIFNYILRYSAWQRDVAALYLNYDLKRSLQESPFTEEIHGLLKHLEERNWVILECAHLYVSLFLGSTGKQEAPSYVAELADQFIKIASSGGDIFHEMAPVFLQDLFTAIFTQTKIGSTLDASQLIDLKLLHDMLRFMARADLISSANMNELKRSPLYPRVQAFEKAIVTLTNTMKTIYTGYGHTLQNLPLDPKALHQAKHESANLVLYLTDLKQVEGNFMFPIHETKDDVKTLQHTSSNLRDDRNAISAVHESKEGISLNPIVKTETSNGLSPSFTSSPNQKYVSLQDEIFHGQWAKGLEETPISFGIIEASRSLLEEFEKSRMLALKNHENSLVFQKIQVEKILNIPVEPKKIQ